jgi:hypothetical protein
MEAALRLPEGKQIRENSPLLYGMLSDPSIRAEFQAVLSLASVRDILHDLYTTRTMIMPADSCC